MSGVWSVYIWELRKMWLQLRAKVILAVCVLGPFVFDIVLGMQDRLPKDQVFGRYLHASGFATPLVLLGFGSMWAFPLLTAVIAGDVFSSEDQYGTLKTILTRSRSRREIFLGKVLAACTMTTLAVVVLCATSIIAGVTIIGHQPLVDLSGQLVPAHTAWVLVVASWAASLMPVLGFTCLALVISVASRSTAIGVVGPIIIGLLMQMYSFLNGADPIRHVMLTTPFNAWHGLLHDPQFVGPMLNGAVVCGAYALASLVIAYRMFRRRDVSGG